MPKKIYTITQTREVQVEATSPTVAATLANKAFYGKRSPKPDPDGMILSVVQVKSTTTREGV